MKTLKEPVGWLVTNNNRLQVKCGCRFGIKHVVNKWAPGPWSPIAWLRRFLRGARRSRNINLSVTPMPDGWFDMEFRLHCRRFATADTTPGWRDRHHSCSTTLPGAGFCLTSEMGHYHYSGFVERWWEMDGVEGYPPPPVMFPSLDLTILLRAERTPVNLWNISWISSQTSSDLSYRHGASIYKLHPHLLYCTYFFDDFICRLKAVREVRDRSVACQCRLCHAIMPIYVIPVSSTPTMLWSNLRTQWGIPRQYKWLVSWVVQVLMYKQ